MPLQSISKVSKAYGVSTRTLRYYEQLGLLQSSKRPDYAYRVYDEQALARLRQILILRKLRISLKQIAILLETRDARLAIELFERSIAQLQTEKNALETIEQVLKTLVEELEKLLPQPLSPAMFEQQQIVELLQALSVKTLALKEEAKMEDLNRASDVLEQPKDIRIIYLPPMTIASAHLTGDNTEELVNEQIHAFMKSSNLISLKPDFRRIGFNNPAGQSASSGGSLGYEAWVSIPDDLEVPPPLQRKLFQGGLYAAHVIAFGDFHEWGHLLQWVKASDQYELDFTPRTDPTDAEADKCLEETLDAIHHLNDTSPFGTQLDLLAPIKPR